MSPVPPSLAAPLVLCALWAIASFAYRALELRELGRFGRRTRAAAGARPREAGSPPLALLRPLCGAPDNLHASLESLWRAAEAQATPIHIAIADPDDPAHACVARLRAAHPKVPVELRTGAAAPGANRKVANLLQLDSPEGCEVLVLSDADIRVPADYVAQVARPFEHPGVGYATAAYRSIPAASQSLASRFDSHLQNLYFLPNTCFSVALEGLNFGLGSTLAVRKQALEEIGGLASLADEAADDGRLAKRVHARGWRGTWLPMLVDHLLEDVGWRAALARHLRCARATRSLRPAGYLGLMIVTHGWLAALLGGVLWAQMGGIAWLPVALWWSGIAALQWPRRREIPLRAGDLALGPLLDLASLAIQLGAHTGTPEGPAAAGPPSGRVATRYSQKS